MLRWDANFRRYVLTIITLGVLSLGPLIVAGSVAAVTLETSSSMPLDILVLGLALAGFVWLPGLVLASLVEALYAAACVVSLSLGYDILVRDGDGRGTAR